MKIADLSPEEQQKVREYNRTRKQKSREKQRLQQIAKMMSEVDRERARRMNEEGLQERKIMNRCFFGEISPGVDASTIADALQVCREFARALDQPDVQSGESLYDFEKRVWDVWANQGGPFLNRKTQVLSPGWGSHWMVRDYWTQKPFEEIWKPLPGAKKPLDVTSLSALPAPTPAAPPPAPIELSANVPSDEEIREHGGEQLLRQPDTSLSPDACRYLNGEPWR